MNNQIDLNALVGYMVMIMMIGMMMKVMTKELKPAVERPLIYGPRGEVLTHHSSSEVRQLGEPKAKAERMETHRRIYGTSELPERGKGREVTTIKCPICGEEIEVKEYNRITRSEALRRHLEEKHGTTAHSIHGPERQKLVDQFGTWAVGRAESVCPEDDVACVEREAGRLIYAYRRSFTG